MTINIDAIKLILQPSSSEDYYKMQRHTEQELADRLIITLMSLRLKFINLYPEMLTLDTPFLESFEIINSIIREIHVNKVLDALSNAADPSNLTATIKENMEMFYKDASHKIVMDILSTFPQEEETNEYN